MAVYTSFDYLCNEPFYVSGIGHIRCPTLRDIRKVTYRNFLMFVNTVSIPPEALLKLNITDAGNAGEDAKDGNSYFDFLLSANPRLLMAILDFFISDRIAFHSAKKEFDVLQSIDGREEVIGHITGSTFGLFRKELTFILGLSEPEKEQVQFKNKLARKMYHKLQVHDNQLKKKADSRFELDNMIRKYCTHNKVGINILNVWDMSYYQFMIMCSEYFNGRQYDIHDSMAAHSFQFKRAADYKPMDYMNKIG